MKLTPPANENYAATIVRIRTANQLANCDNVVGIPMFGFQAITSKDVKVGELYVLFTAGTQLSPDYATRNNLHRHSDLNDDPNAKGYLEDNRRVKALRFRGHNSSALLMPLASLAYTGFDVSKLQEGNTFDELDGEPICRKYEVRRRRSSMDGAQGRRRQEPRVDEAHFPKHFDTANFFKNSDLLDPEREVVVTQKLHGTSVRIANTVVKRKLTRLERVARWFGVKVRETEYAYVYGSRNVTKDPDNPFDDTGFYGVDIYTEVGSRLKGLLPKGFMVFGEIVGWTPGGTPIQQGYTYQIPVCEARLYIYRVAYVNPEGITVDLSWDGVKAFCAAIGVETVPELSRGPLPHPDLIDIFIDRRFADEKEVWGHALPTEGNYVDEGVCVRQERPLTPLVLKAKSPKFFEFESRVLDEGLVDMESMG